MWFRKSTFAEPQYRSRPVGNRPVVRKPTFNDADSPTIAPYTQEERVNGMIRAKRIRTVHIDLPTEVRPGMLRRFWEWLQR